MAPRVGLGEHSHLRSNAGGTGGKVSMGELVLQSGEQHRTQSATGCRCVQDLQEQRFMTGDISNGEGHLADLSSVALNTGWKRCSMQDIAMKPPLWIHAWRHLTATSEEEHKVNVDRAKRAFTANTPFTTTRHARDNSNM